jgi:DNA polymerase III delta prime subunit
MLPLVEKMRPKKLQDMILTNDYFETFDNMIKKNELPTHLLFYGQPGSGKTTLAWILIKEIQLEYMFINGSSERGIETVRSKIEPYTQLQNLDKKHRVVFIDEYDKFSNDAYDAMRPLLEASYKNVRFVCTCNYIQNVPPPIQSRFMPFEFRPLSKDQSIEYVKKRIIESDVQFNDEDLSKIYNISKGDMRKFITMIQKSMINKKIVVMDNDEIDKFISTYKSQNIKTLLEFVVNTSLPFEEMYNILFSKVKSPQQAIVLADYMYKDHFCMDKSVNFTACICSLWKLLSGGN